MEYEPYGNLWEREMMNWSKQDLIKFLKRELIKRSALPTVKCTCERCTGIPDAESYYRED